MKIGKENLGKKDCILFGIVEDLLSGLCDDQKQADIFIFC